MDKSKYTHAIAAYLDTQRRLQEHADLKEKLKARRTEVGAVFAEQTALAELIKREAESTAQKVGLGTMAMSDLQSIMDRQTNAANGAAQTHLVLQAIEKQLEQLDTEWNHTNGHPIAVARERFFRDIFEVFREELKVVLPAVYNAFVANALASGQLSPGDDYSWRTFAPLIFEAPDRKEIERIAKELEDMLR